MTEDRNREDRFVVTDHDRIRRLADSEDAEPVSVERGDAEDVRIRVRPDDPDAALITWDEFFDRFEEENRAVQYRPDETGTGSEAVLEVVDRSTRTMSVADDETGASPNADAADKIETDDPDTTATESPVHERRGSDSPADASTADSTDDPADVETEPLATGDTGDAEPVAFERTEDDDRIEPADTDHASTASTADAERDVSSAAAGLVLDRIHERQSGLESWDRSDEFLVFKNTGEAELDLSGWTVENGAGRSYRFPSGTVLNPGEGVTLHSEDGDDTADHLYWGADEPVWNDDEITVVVRTDAGDRVLRERYET